MSIWISRDNYINSPYKIWCVKPKIYGKYYSADFTKLGKFCHKTFDKYSKAGLKPGELKKIKKVNFELD